MNARMKWWIDCKALMHDAELFHLASTKARDEGDKDRFELFADLAQRYYWRSRQLRAALLDVPPEPQMKTLNDHTTGLDG